MAVPPTTIMLIAVVLVLMVVKLLLPLMVVVTMKVITTRRVFTKIARVGFAQTKPNLQIIFLGFEIECKQNLKLSKKSF